MIQTTQKHNNVTIGITANNINNPRITVSIGTSRNDLFVICALFFSIPISNHFFNQSLARSEANYDFNIFAEHEEYRYVFLNISPLRGQL